MRSQIGTLFSDTACNCVNGGLSNWPTLMKSIASMHRADCQTRNTCLFFNEITKSRVKNLSNEDVDGGAINRMTAVFFNDRHATTVTETLNGDASGHNGSILVDTATVNYLDLEPVSLAGTMANLVINLPTGDGNNQGFATHCGDSGENENR